MASLKKFNESQKKRKIVELIDSKGTTKGYPRAYIGMSGLGGCVRSLWYSFRWVKQGEISGRTNRIFNVGHAAEETMVKDLESIGIECWNVLDDQAEYECAFGYSKAHPDGACKNIPGEKNVNYLLEFKTMNDSSFKDTVKNGVKKSKPIYYAQMVLYMHFGGFGKALFMSMNKNNSEYYTEIVNCNEEYAKELVSKAESIVWCEDPSELPRIGNNTKQWYECKWCNYNDICFGDLSELEENCRNCENCNLLGEGKFGCELKNDAVMTLEEQIKGCTMYKRMNGLKQ